MISGNRFYSRRAFALHGLLLGAVLVASYLSVRAQYEALRDGQIEEARTDQQLTTRFGALSLQSRFQLIFASLAGVDRDDIDPPGPWLTAAGTLDRDGAVVSVHRGTAAALVDAVGKAEWARRLDGPAIYPSERGPLVLAVPVHGGQRVAVGLVPPEQLLAELMTVAQRSGIGTATIAQITATRLLVVAEDGRVLAGGADDVGRWLGPTLDPKAARVLSDLLTSGNAGSEPIDTGALTLLSVHPFSPVPGRRLAVVSVRDDVLKTVDQRLRPIFLQLITQSALMLLAVMAVLISTTVSLTRGRRRIERMRTDMLNRDLAKARRIQLNWLPAPTLVAPHIEIAAENTPALHISGDFYNWFELPDDGEDKGRKTALVIGDVSGHGMPAAFLMATTQLLVRNTMPRVRDPGKCLAEINRQLASLVYNGQFVTMMILVIDHDSAGLEIASAGHQPPLLKRDGQVEELPIESQLVVGVDDTVEYQTQRLRTRAGDTLLLYTDGAIEMTNEAGEQFGIPRLSASFAEATDGPLSVLATIDAALISHRRDKDPDDDLTLIAVQVVQAEATATVSSDDLAGQGI